MNQKPILFSTPMVQSIIENRKTKTRRIVPSKILDAYYDYDDWANSVGKPEGIGVFRTFEKEYFLDACKYRKGDLLWVKETCLWVLRDHASDLLEGAKDSTQWVYKASIDSDWMGYAKEKYGYKWKPSIFMPKDAARIWLEITNIEVERLQDISEKDAIAEGIFCMDYIGDEPKYSPIESFKTLWESINGAESWDANPWVYVLEFKRIEKP